MTNAIAKGDWVRIHPSSAEGLVDLVEDGKARIFLNGDSGKITWVKLERLSKVERGG